MDHYAPRKYRGPEIWARVRQAYLAGEPAPSVARRFDVGLDNLRRRATHEGWTRREAARRCDLPPGPVADGGALPEEGAEYPVATRDAVKRAAERAAWLIAEGRGAEAMALIRAAEALSNLVDSRDLDQETPVQRFLRQRPSTVARAKAQPL